MANKSSRFWNLLSAVLPETIWADSVYAFIKFVRVHRRLPSTRAMMLNDMLYRIKTSGELVNPLRVFLTDKEYFKVYVKSILGDNYVVPTLKVLRSKEEVDAFIFPREFCVKPTHLSGSVMISRGGRVDKEELKSWLELNHYHISRERNYLFLRPKIIVEPIIFGQEDITDYRIFCYRGKAKLICLDIGKYSQYRRAFYSIDWVRQNFSLGYPIYEGMMERPSNLEEMIRVTEQLAQGLDFVRVDIYSNGNKILFGEMTHCHASASQRFLPLEAEYNASRMIFGDE